MFEELLEALMEGGQPQQSSRSVQASPWGGLLEGILGGGPGRAGDDGFGLDDIISGFIGGGRGMSSGSNPMLAPFAEMLSERLGVSPQLAAMVISIALPLLMKQMSSGGIDKIRSGGGLDLDSLLDEGFLQKSGASRKLAEQSGMDEQEAASSLKEAIGILSGKEKAAATAPPVRPSTPPSNANSLEHLLDSWD